MAPVHELTLPLSEVQIERLKQTSQNPKYHGEGNVYNHTLLVLSQFFKYANTHPLSPEDEEVLYWAAVLHDIGKPLVTRWVHGRWSSRGHERAGVPISRDILLHRPEVSPAQRRRILDLVRWHHVPLRWGLAKKSYSDYKILATRTDLRMLGIFSLLDILGRECVRKQEVLALILEFLEVVVPRVESELGTYYEIQRSFQAAGQRKKNALWTAYQHGEALLLEKLLHIKLPGTEASAPTCILTIGSPRAGKTEHVSYFYPDYVRFDLKTHLPSFSDGTVQNSRISEVTQQIQTLFRQQRNVVLDGSNLEGHTRLQLSAFVREYGAQVHYLIFERSLQQLRIRNKAYLPPMNDKELAQAHAQLDIPHPWEAHVLEMV